MTTALLATTYFGPIQWYQKLNRYDRCIIEQHDSFCKQTYRNRCVIATANGLQVLTVPVEHAAKMPDGTTQKIRVKDLTISDHHDWRRTHWNAIESAYSESPFFEYYADDLRLLFDRPYKYLVDMNEDARQTICRLLDITADVGYSTEYMTIGDEPVGERTTRATVNNDNKMMDFRNVIDHKHPLPDPECHLTPYWQVFGRRHGFLPNLSILDLLFCMGPEGIFYL